MTQATKPSPIAIDETRLAEALGMSVHFLRKDRRTKRLIPFYRLGGSIRYNLTSVTNALAACEEGGQRPQPRKRAPKALT